MKSYISKIKWWQILLIIVVLLFIPFPTQMLSEWKLQVFNEQNVPLKNIKVEQSWTNYTFIASDGFDERQTDESGIVVFPKRLLWAGLCSRVISPVLAEIWTLAHGSTGVGVSVRVFDDNYYSNNLYWHNERDKENPLPNIIIAKQRDDKQENIERPMDMPNRGIGQGVGVNRP